MRPARAFTLIELLIVVAIIAILAAIAVPNFLEAQTRAKVSRAKADMRSLATAIEAYRIDHNRYPVGWWTPATATIEARWAQVTTPVAFITAIPPDPFGDMVDLSIPAPPWEYRTFDFLVDNRDIAGQHAFFEDLYSFGHSTETQWYTASQGPDTEPGATQQPGPAPNSNSHLGLIYDPTNGTVSLGDIIRTGPSGIAE
ncbi:prepilin-type N-terminal cleavage/methylation domain-containing protein [Candidatus Sumerlaeota bacterium]|nr:prepilin-type N-terminal cleavage/methylation domain-containing protein [Candidatus Sumerlaeota bacterium]